MGSHFYSNCCAPGRVREARVAAIQIMQWYTIQLIRLREMKVATRCRESSSEYSKLYTGEEVTSGRRVSRDGPAALRPEPRGQQQKSVPSGNSTNPQPAKSPPRKRSFITPFFTPAARQSGFSIAFDPSRSPSGA